MIDPLIRSQFSQLVEDHSEAVGFSAPQSLRDYLALILAERFDRPGFIPEPTFAEAYLRLYSSYRPGVYREFADSTLVFCSLLPDHGQRRGISRDYYASLGISTYYTLADLAHDARYTELGNWFYHCQGFLCSLFHPQRPLQLVNLH